MKFFGDAEKTNNCIALLQSVGVLCGGGKVLGFEPQARADALMRLVRLNQGQLTLEEFVNEFKARYNTLKTLGGDLENKNDTWTGPDGASVTTNQALLVCLFLGGVNTNEYGECTRSLRNDAASKLM